MNDVSTILERSRTDVHLQAYLLKRLCRQSPRTVLANAEEFVPVFGQFDGMVATEVLDELARHQEPEFHRFLLHLLAQDPRWFIQVKAIRYLVNQTPPERVEAPAGVRRALPGPGGSGASGIAVPHRTRAMGEPAAAALEPAVKRPLRQVEPRIVSALLAMLAANPNPRVKASLLSSLGQIRVDIPMKTIKPYLTHADSRIRASALEALLGRDLTGLGDVFALLLNDPAPRVKALAAVGLWRLGNPILLELVNDAEQLDHRISYLYALGLTGKDGQTRRLLIRSLKSSNLPERLMACRSLRTVADADDLDQLLETAVELPGRETREGVARTCGAIDHVRSQSIILGMLQESEKSRNPRQVASLLAMVGCVGGEPDLEYLCRYLDSPDGRVRANAVETLAPHSELASVRDQLLACYASEVARVKVNAALPLWRSGIQVVMRGLKEMILSTQSRLRASAAWGLGKIGGIVARSYLERALDDPDEATRRLAFAGLAVEP